MGTDSLQILLLEPILEWYYMPTSNAGNVIDKTEAEFFADGPGYFDMYKTRTADFDYYYTKDGVKEMGGSLAWKLIPPAMVFDKDGKGEASTFSLPITVLTDSMRGAVRFSSRRCRPRNWDQYENACKAIRSWTVTLQRPSASWTFLPVSHMAAVLETRGNNAPSHLETYNDWDMPLLNAGDMWRSQGTLADGQNLEKVFKSFTKNTSNVHGLASEAYWDKDRNVRILLNGDKNDPQYGPINPLPRTVGKLYQFYLVTVEVVKIPAMFFSQKYKNLLKFVFENFDSDLSLTWLLDRIRHKMPEYGRAACGVLQEIVGKNINVLNKYYGISGNIKPPQESRWY